MITHYFLSNDSEALISCYVSNPHPFDLLVHEINEALNIGWVENFAEFIIDLHDLYRENIVLFVKWELDSPVGLIFLTKEETLFIPYVIVKKSHRCKGIGQLLLKVVREQNPGVPMSLFCPKDNINALDFYQSNGFIPTDKINNAHSIYLLRP